MTTMLLGGLWHGASLNFVFWGLIHGLALVLTRVIQRLGFLESIPAGVRRGVGVFITFHVVCAAWIFFRAAGFEEAFAVFESLGSLDMGTANLTLAPVLILVAAFALHWIPDVAAEKAARFFHKVPAPAQAAALVLVLVVLRRLALTEVTPFIYFQF